MILIGERTPAVISMDTFTWQVAATFFAAAIAGVVALVIGLRQVGIADGQRLIAKEQADTAKAAIEVVRAQALTARLAQRGALFDRRFEVYEAVQNYLVTSLDGKLDELFSLDKGIRSALSKSRFLFPETVELAFQAALMLADECAQLAYSRRTNPTDHNSARLKEVRQAMFRILSSLKDTMGEEMRLYITQEPTTIVTPPPIATRI